VKLSNWLLGMLKLLEHSSTFKRFT